MTGKTSITDIAPYITKDGSEIRELIHPDHHGAHNQSLAEARIPPGGKTQLHRHRLTEEIYHVTRGRGRMTLGRAVFDIETGESMLIPAGTPHCVENTGDGVLHILCSCAPAYSHDDTELLG